MFLTHGVNQHNEFISIDLVPRGLTTLKCPYCGQLLIAKKGRVKGHHFAHNGDTCLEVRERIKQIALPFYDKFNVHISAGNWKTLKSFYEGARITSKKLENLERLRLVTFNRFSRSWEITKMGKIPFGELSLSMFADIQDSLIQKKHDELATAVEHEGRSITDLRLFRAQLKRALQASLYLLEIKHTDGTYYKIGVTSRDINERISEIQQDVQSLDDVSIKLLRIFRHRGAVEPYFKERYKRYQTNIGNLTEYFEFDSQVRRRVLSDLTRLSDKSCTTLDLEILRDHSHPLETEIKRREKNLSISEGMKQASARGVHVGRPKGTTESDNEFLSKYKPVVEALRKGLSLRKTAQETGVSVNTIRKVKSMLSE